MRPSDLEEAFDLITNQLCDAEAKLRCYDSLLQDLAAFVGACRFVRFAQPDGLEPLRRDATRLYSRLARWSSLERSQEEFDPFYEMLKVMDVEHLLPLRKRLEMAGQSKMVEILTEEIKERERGKTA